MSTTADPTPTRPRAAFVAFAAAVAPSLAAVWAFPAFVTQDGPAHLYNAHVLQRVLFDPKSTFRDTFTVALEPLPNWAGHLAGLALVSALPPRAADRAATTLTLLAPAVAFAWLRWRVAGCRGLAFGAGLSALLALNVAWLLGFTSFLLGASLFPVTLGVWWSGRDAGFRPRRAGGLAALVVVGYFCHLVSLGLTAAGLAVLEALTPGRDRAGRARTTALGLAPLLPLGLVYLRLMRRGGGGLAPEWKHLASPLSPRAWGVQLSWVDPVSLARRDVLPLVDGASSPAFLSGAPVVWLALAVGLAVVSTLAVAPPWRGERRGWWGLSLLLLAAGAAGPDTLGASHGEYLQQRVVLLGLAALVPALRVEDAPRGVAAAAVLALGLAVALQSAFVWDYARTCRRTAGAYIDAAPAVGTHRRVAALASGIRTRFRANPLMHADGLLGVGTGNVLWNDYETRFYYFPVHFRGGLDRPDPKELEDLALLEGPGAAGLRADRWRRLLERHGDAIDVLVVWGDDPLLDAVNARWFRPVPVPGGGPLRVFRRDRGARD